MQNDDFQQNMLSHPLATTVAYYATCLMASGKAVAYLARNCLSADIELQVGFTDRSLGKQIPIKLLRAGKAIRTELENLGVY